jgi:hypothetical protein
MTNRNQLASILIGFAFAISAAAVGCSGGGSSEIEDLCEDFCEASLECVDLDDAQSLCEDECNDDFEEAEDLDGEMCVDTQVAASECAEALPCDVLLPFLAIELKSPAAVTKLFFGDYLCVLGVQDCCETELLVNYTACPETRAFE